jgi:two-component system, NarL family, response regulator LiaR
MRIRVLIVDDHAIVREGLRALIDGKPDLTLVGEAVNGEEAVRMALAEKPDVILMDLVMPRMNGIQAIREIRTANPQARILVLTSFAEDEQVFEAIRGGALGYLLKDSSPGELIEAIRCVHQGQPSLHPAVARKLMLGYHQPAPPALPNQIGEAVNVPVPHPTLSDREIEVLRLVARGLSNMEIAQQLFVGEGTVRFHVSNILSKLQLENRTQAVLYALRQGLASLE